MELVVVNSRPAGKARPTTFNGRDYLVAPMTLIVPGVVPGSEGPLLYPLEELARNYQAWNYMPIVINHPLRAGRHVSAREPAILEQSGVGFVFNTSLNGRLRAEGWFDVERTRQVDARVLDRLERGEPLELSTGLYVDTEAAPQGAVWNTPGGPRPYHAVARNYRPDHLAVLPDQRGACAVADGCGVLVNRLGESAMPSISARLGTQLAGFVGAGADWNEFATWARSLPPGEYTTLKSLSVNEQVEDAGSLDRELAEATVEAPPETDGAVAVAGRLLSILGDYVEPTGRLSVVANELSHSDLERRLEALLLEKYLPAGRPPPNSSLMDGVNPSPYLIDVYDDHIVYRWLDKTYTLDYTVDDQTDKVTLNTDEPVEVARVTDYVPVDNAFCATGEGGGIDPSCSPSSGKQGTEPPTPTMPGGHKEWGKVLKPFTEAELGQMADRLISHVGDSSFKEQVEWQAGNYQGLHGSGLAKRPEALRARAALETYVSDASNAAGMARVAASAYDKGASSGHPVSSGDEKRAWRAAWKIANGHPVSNVANIDGLTLNQLEDLTPAEACEVLSEGEFEGEELSYDDEEFLRERCSGFTANAGKGGLSTPDVTPEKACKILKDGTIRGKELTPRQRGLFGIICGRRKKPRGPARNHFVGSETQNSNHQTNFVTNEGEETSMSRLTDEQRRIIVDNLVANTGCSCHGQTMPWPNERAALEKLTDNELAFADGCRKALVQSHASGPGGGSVATGPTAAQGAQRAGGEPTTNVVDPSQIVVPVATPVKAPANMAEALATYGTAQDREVWNSALALHAHKKASVIETIVANVTGEARERLINRLQTKSIDELEELAVLGAQHRVQPQPLSPAVNWFGASAAAVAPPVQEEPLSSPVYSFERRSA